MAKIKNCNVLLSIIFTVIALSASIFDVFYVADRYPVSVNGSFMIATGLCLLLSAIALLMGILASKKVLLIAGGIFYCLKSFIYAIFYIYVSTYSGALRYFSGLIFIKFFSTFILLLLPAIAFVIFVFYLTGGIKNTNLIFTLLFITWLITPFTAYNIAIELLLVSSYILLTKYADVANSAAKVKMGDVFVLSIVTFLIYYVIWSICAAIKTEKFLGKKATFSELWLFSLFYPYSAYWYYTRYEELSESDLGIKNRGILCMTLSLFLLFPMSLCILQRDLNKLSETVTPEEEACEGICEGTYEENNTLSADDEADMAEQDASPFDETHLPQSDELSKED